MMNNLIVDLNIFLRVEKLIFRALMVRFVRKLGLDL